MRFILIQTPVNKSPNNVKCREITTQAICLRTEKTMDNSNGKNVITNPIELKFIQLIATLGSSTYICDPTLLQAT